MTVLGELLAVLSLIAAIAARLHNGRVARRAVGDSDELFHRVYTNIITANRHRLPARFPQFVGPGRNAYPAGYHWVLSFLPDRAVEVLARQGALGGDLLVGGAASLLLTADAGMSTSAAIALVGLYLVTPALTLVNVGPRSFHLTPRTPAQLLYGAMILSVVAADGRISWVLGIGIAGLLALLLLTSKFALQVTIFALPVLVATGPAAAVLGCFAGGCGLAVLVSRGFFVRQVIAQAEHLEWYVKRHLRMVRRINWTILLRALRDRDLRALVRLVTLQNPLTSGLIRHLHVIVGAAWLLVEAPPLNVSVTVAAVFTLAGIAAWLATSVGVLRVLGEPERYLEFALPASWLVFWSLPKGAELVVALAVATIYEAAWHLFNLVVMSGWEEAERVRRSARDEALEVLSTSGASTVLFLDIKDSYAVHNIPGMRAVMFSGHMSLRGEVSGYLDWFFWRYPLVHPRHLEEIIERYGVDIIVAWRDALTTVLEEEGQGYEVGPYPTLFENQRYALFSCPRNNRPSVDHPAVSTSALT